MQFRMVQFEGCVQYTLVHLVTNLVPNVASRVEESLQNSWALRLLRSCGELNESVALLTMYF